MAKTADSDSAAVIGPILAAYAEHGKTVSLFRDQLLLALTSSDELMEHVHSIKTRIKDPGHLQEKLGRKLKECQEKGETFAITPEDLLTRVTDLAGVRILHLYTRQIRDIDAALRKIFEEQKYE